LFVPQNVTKMLRKGNEKVTPGPLPQPFSKGEGVYIILLMCGMQYEFWHKCREYVNTTQDELSIVLLLKYIVRRWSFIIPSFPIFAVD
jgi:hypothetical protein